MRIIEADIDNSEHREAVHLLIHEYFEYADQLLMAAGISFSNDDDDDDDECDDAACDDGVSDDDNNGVVAIMEKFSSSRRGKCLLVEHDGNFVGIGAYHDLGNNRAEMKRVFLQTECRGKSWGKELVIHLIKSARLDGYSFMNLESSTYMQEARSLYESLGFREIEEYCGSVCSSQGMDALYYMELPLNMEKTEK